MKQTRLLFAAAGAFLALGATSAYAACAEAPPTTQARGDHSAIPTMLTTADEALAQGRYGDACVMYRLVLSLDNDHQTARIGLGEGALGEGQFEAARRHFTAVSTQTPDNARARQGVGLSFLFQGDLARAEPELRAAVGLDATLWRSWNGLGVIADSRAEWQAADEAYAQAISAAPSEAGIHNNLGLSRLQRGEPAAAVEAFDVALRLRPALRTAADNRRIALAMTGQYDLALAGVAEGQLAQTLNNVAVIAARRGDRAVADRLFAAAITASPRYYELAARNRDALSAAR